MKPPELERRRQWLALSLSPHLGAKTLEGLLRHFDGDLGAIFAADERALRQVPGGGRKIAREIAALDLPAVARNVRDWERRGVRVLTGGDALYPDRLRASPDYPPALFVRGGWQPALWEKTAAVVGTRAPSQRAKFITLQLADRLARGGYTVVSGLALGIDAAAHVGALQSGGRSIAVLGSGLLRVYPPQNRGIAAKMMRAGALVSEVHPQLPPNAQRLVARNRIISALSSLVIVVESDVDGGAMHTARFAREQGCPVCTFDLPASGNQQLIAGGAAVLADDAPLAFFAAR